MSSTEQTSPTESVIIWLPLTCPSSNLLKDAKFISVHLGNKISKAVLVDSESAKQSLIVFFLKFIGADSNPNGCLNFLASFDGTTKTLEGVFVNRILPEFSSGLPKLTDKFNAINFANGIPKAATLLAQLAELHPQQLFHLTDDIDRKLGSAFRFSLIDSGKNGSRITRVHSSNGCQGQTEDLNGVDAILAVRRSLANKLLSSETEGDQSFIDENLTLRIQDLPAADQSEIEAIVLPAITAYAELVRKERQVDEGPLIVAIADPLFANKSFRDALLKEFSDLGEGSNLVIRFIKDADIVGMLGSLVRDN